MRYAKPLAAKIVILDLSNFSLRLKMYVQASQKYNIEHGINTSFSDVSNISACLMDKEIQCKCYIDNTAFYFTYEEDFEG